METKTLEDVVFEAIRFVEKAEALIKAREKHPNKWSNPRESGAVKRASLDLTRRLADLREGRD